MSNAAVINALGNSGVVEDDLAAVQTTLEGGVSAANALFAGGWSSALSLGAQAGPALLYAVGVAGSLAGVMGAAGYIARTAANLTNAAPNAAALPPPDAPGSVLTLP